jgi:hypothetical protein
MRKTLTPTLLLSIMLTLALTGCSEASNEKIQIQETPKIGESQVAGKKEQAWHQVTVNYYDIEGGFYGLISQTGDKLLPMNLAKQFKFQGTVLKVKGELIKDMMTIQQWGQPFRIIDVELIKLGQSTGKNKGAEY